eukprot:Rmarinus@m.12561
MIRASRSYLAPRPLEPCSCPRTSQQAAPRRMVVRRIATILPTPIVGTGTLILAGADFFLRGTVEAGFSRKGTVLRCTSLRRRLARPPRHNHLLPLHSHPHSRPHSTSAHPRQPPRTQQSLQLTGPATGVLSPPLLPMHQAAAVSQAQAQAQWSSGAEGLTALCVPKDRSAHLQRPPSSPSVHSRTFLRKATTAARVASVPACLPPPDPVLPQARLPPLGTPRRARWPPELQRLRHPMGALLLPVQRSTQPPLTRRQRVPLPEMLRTRH